MVASDLDRWRSMPHLGLVTGVISRERLIMRTSRLRLHTVVGTLALFVLATGVSAHGYKMKSLEIVHPWAMETAGKTASVSMKIASKAHEADRLLSASSTIAERVELAAAAAGSGFVVPAGGELQLTSTGPHIALDGLRKPLNAYGTFPLSLMFERAGRIDIEVMVEAAE
ncbi:MAG TPA: copper chaperone PCu(A)C [Hyphomicrobiaceae bacterium]|nr:copper chaperone PCu(A)C [Hyphomicrobiaceae bacterium]